MEEAGVQCQPKMAVAVDNPQKEEAKAGVTAFSLDIFIFGPPLEGVSCSEGKSFIQLILNTLPETPQGVSPRRFYTPPS